MKTDASPLTRLRLLLGLLQGALLYGLYRSIQDRAWPATEPLLLAPVLMLCVFLPVLAISAAGGLSRRAMGRWMLTVALLIGALACYDVWRMSLTASSCCSDPGARVQLPSIQAWLAFAVGLFMAHVLVLAAALERRRVASYATYFDLSWKLGIQHVFSGAFLGALWLVLTLGAALFGLIGLSFLQRLLSESWFAIPVSTFAVAWALHLTDVKPEIVRGIRGLILVLLSWILPVIVVLVAGFLASLPITGLQPLWATRHATAVLLITAAALVILINTAFQNGQRGEDVHRAVRWSAWLGCMLLLPLVGLAVHALDLRVDQHGWSSDRVVAAACLGVAGCYAVGYAWAAIRRADTWLAPMATVNVGVTWVILLLLVAVFSPLADPARLAVQDQIARLRDGRVPPERFDFAYLRFGAGRHGEVALRALASGQAGMPVAQAQAISSLAQRALARKTRWSEERQSLALDAQGIARNIKAVWPAGQRLPDSFALQKWQGSEGQPLDWRLPGCLRRIDVPCEAVLLQLDDDAGPEVLILQAQPSSSAVLFDQDGSGVWRVVSGLPVRLAACESDRQRLRSGQFGTLPPRYRDLDLGGRRVPVRNDLPSEDPPAPSSEAGCR